MSTRQLLPLIGALFALYIIWGSTYFAIAVGVASWPPLMMAGVRQNCPRAGVSFPVSGDDDSRTSDAPNSETASDAADDLPPDDGPKSARFEHGTDHIRPVGASAPPWPTRRV